jgi:transposase-like protein
MARKHPPYAPEFRRQMIELVRAGRTPEELAKEFEPSGQTIRNWVAQMSGQQRAQPFGEDKKQPCAFVPDLQTGNLNNVPNSLYGYTTPSALSTGNRLAVN